MLIIRTSIRGVALNPPEAEISEMGPEWSEMLLILKRALIAPDVVDH